MGEQAVKDILFLMINDMVDFFNIGKTMNENQVNQTVDLIIEEFYYLKIEDFKLFFKRAKLQKYGKVYDRIDGAVIFEWLGEYDMERLEEAEKLSQNKGIENKIEAEKIISQIKPLEIQKFKSEPTPPKTERKRTEQEIMANKWLNQFDKLNDKQNLDLTGSIKFVKVRGKIIDRSAFLDYKLQQYLRVKKYLTDRLK